MGQKTRENLSEPETLAGEQNIGGLLERAIGGDAEAFRECVRLHANRVNAVAYQMTGNVEDARDIAQEVFIRLYRSLKQYDSRYPFTTWLYRLTVNISIDYLRKNSRPKHLSIDGTDKPINIEDDRPLPDACAERHEFHGAIRKLVGELSVNQRKVFVLRDLQGCSTQEVALILGCRCSTVRVHLARARLRIKVALQEHYPDLMEVRHNEMPKS